MITRKADKWARSWDGSEWHEKWNEFYTPEGKTERDACKFGSLPPGVRQPSTLSPKP